MQYKVTVERDDQRELMTYAKVLDVWCIQHFGLPGLDANWHRNRNRIYEKKGEKRWSKIYYTIYSFRDQAHAFEFKLSHM